MKEQKPKMFGTATYLFQHIKHAQHYKSKQTKNSCSLCHLLLFIKLMYEVDYSSKKENCRLFKSHCGATLFVGHQLM